MTRPIVPPHRPTPSLLLVDDDPMPRETLSTLLTQEGFHVVTAATGEEAELKLSERRQARVACRQRGSNPLHGWKPAVSARGSSQPVPRTPATPTLLEVPLFDQGSEVLLQCVPAGPC